jgi:enamine deaminase RidA (YjgF/YER057c/UK114 family)
MQAIIRLLPDAQFCRVVVHNGVVHLAGQPAKDRSASVKLQTAEILRSLDALLAKAGTDKSRLLSAVIHLADMRHKAEMDEAWITWVDPHNTPARAVVETRLGNLGSGVMIRVTAAL